MRHDAVLSGSMRRDGRSLVVAPALALLLLGACSIAPPAQDPPATYDLGPSRAVATTSSAARATLLIADIVAPVWLDHAGIMYRLGYHDPARHRIYANSRWVAAPAALLTQRLRHRYAAMAAGVVASGDGVRADYALRLELEDFSQFFETPEATRVAVAVRATLVRLGDRTLQAQRSFTVERPAAPDAGGAVAGLSDASDALLREVLGWTAEQLGANRPTGERRAK